MFHMVMFSCVEMAFTSVERVIFNRKKVSFSRCSLQQKSFVQQSMLEHSRTKLYRMRFRGNSIKSIRRNTGLATAQTFQKERQFVQESGFQTISDGEPFVNQPHTVTTYHLVPGKLVYQMSFDQNFGKPEQTQIRHEQNGCKKL